MWGNDTIYISHCNANTQCLSVWVLLTCCHTHTRDAQIYDTFLFFIFFGFVAKFSFVLRHDWRIEIVVERAQETKYSEKRKENEWEKRWKKGRLWKSHKTDLKPSDEKRHFETAHTHIYIVYCWLSFCTPCWDLRCVCVCLYYV